MSSWLSLVAPALASVALIAVLGLPAALALRLRGFALALVAVPAAFAVLALASIVAPFVGVSWSILPPLALAVILAAVLLGLRRWLGVPRAADRADAPRARARDLWLPLGAAAVGGAAIAISLVAGMKSADAISQTFDAGFHLNAVRYVLDTGSASPLTMELTSPGVPVFYPTLWHAFVSLIVQLTGASIPLATNAALFSASAVVWPIGAVALGRAVAGPSIRATLISGALAAAFPNFPLFLASYGVIYPNLLALALLPFLLVAVLQLLALGPARRSTPLPAGTRWLLFVGALGAAVLAHPNMIHVLIVWGAVPVLYAALRALRGRPISGSEGLVLPRAPLGLRRAGAILGVAAFALATVVAWIAGRTTDNTWEGFFGPRSAAVQLIGGTPHMSGHAWGVSLLVVLGAALAWRHRSLRWLIGSAATLALFYYISDAFPSSEWRTFFLSPWYNDPRRLAALVPFGAIPLAALGASAGWAMLRPGLRRFAALGSSARPRRVAQVLAAGALLFLLATGQSGTLSTMQALRTSYDEDLERLSLIDVDERELLERLAEDVPEGERIANNPLNGSGLSYAIADREVLFPHGSGRYDARGYELVDSLVHDPERACAVSREIDVEYVLDFGTRFIFENDIPRSAPFKRMKDLERSPILSEIDREGDAVLYRIDGCG